MEEILEEKQKIKKEIEACIRTNMTQLVQGCKMQREKQVRHYHTDTKTESREQRRERKGRRANLCFVPVKR
jgi:hypothetical protein